MHRWIIDKKGRVNLGQEDSHNYLIIERYGTDDWLLIFEEYLTGGYIYDGRLEVVKSAYERDFDPQWVADQVSNAARRNDIEVTSAWFYPFMGKGYEALEV